ncbi:thioredoxin-like protein [Aureobasidium subglaciale]|nr:thioredoxin-like protein [Aureobasidium subglaciale]
MLSAPLNKAQAADERGAMAIWRPYTSIQYIKVTKYDNNSIHLISSLQGLVILFCYPRTGAPGEAIPDSWNSIPGARGCTPQACSFRDTQREFMTAGVNKIFGLSTQSSTYQQEAKTRLHLPFELLSDEKLDFVEALSLPTIDWEGKKLTKRITLAIVDGKIVKIWYPVFPPDKSAQQVLDWLAQEKTGAQKFGGNRRLSVT